MNFSCWECADDHCLGTMVSLLNGLLYASLQLPLDNRENKNSRNVCLSQIRENIFPLKFLLIQYPPLYIWTIKVWFIIQKWNETASFNVFCQRVRQPFQISCQCDGMSSLVYCLIIFLLYFTACYTRPHWFNGMVQDSGSLLDREFEPC